MTVLVYGLVAAMILAAWAVMWAALTWAGYIRRMGERARRQEARAEARRLASICEAELRPECRTRGQITDRLAIDLEARGHKDADMLAADVVGELMAERT